MPHYRTTWHYIPELNIFDNDLQLAVNGGGGGLEKDFGMFICLQDMFFFYHHTEPVCNVMNTKVL